MRTAAFLVIAVLLAVVVGLVPAQSYAPPPVVKPDDATLKEIDNRTEKLAQRLTELQKRNVRDPGLGDVEIYLKAARSIVRLNEFYDKNAGAWTLAVLNDGLLRASQAGQGDIPWLSQPGVCTVRTYRSRIDGSLQPYAVTLPHDYGKDQAKRWRIDVVLHGRDGKLSEVKFLHDHSASKVVPKDQGFVQIDIFGRGNNAYRWAGETDVMETISHFLGVEAILRRGGLLDTSRVVLRGFSMGGAGTWHLGLHHPDQWCVMGPGAGFATTHGYIKDLPEKLPPYQEACLSIYDAVDYAENAFDVPVVAYSGGDDKQKAAADLMEERIKKAGLSMTHLVAPGLGHDFPAEWRKKAEAEYAKFADKGRANYPKRVRFVTYTLKYPSCEWVRIGALEKHYARALVDAERTEDGFAIKTNNVRIFTVSPPQGAGGGEASISIDGEKLEVKPYLNNAGSSSFTFQKVNGKWVGVLPEKVSTDALRKPYKAPGQTGPIDDAFTESFLCVRGSGKPWHEATEKYADENLKRFQAEWGRYFRGELPVKHDTQVTPEDIASKHLILFGDPSSNSLIAQVLDALPLQWTAEKIQLADKTVSAADHVPVLIYPSPLNARAYVVLNSGHTFHAAEFLDTNAQLYPRLGDYALLKPTPTEKDGAAAEVVTAGLFDDFWQLVRNP